MVKTLHYVKGRSLTDTLVFLLLVCFVFGQLPGFLVNRLGIFPFRVHLFDLIAILLALVLVVRREKFPVWLKSLIVFCLWAVFGFIFSLFANLSSFSFQSLFYLIRLITYSLLFWALIGYNKERDKKLIIDSLIIVGLFVAVFGWVQYFLVPDLRSLKLLGWDDHYYRLVSTFLDPAFCGIVLVLTDILLFVKYLEKRSKYVFMLGFFVLLTLGFTYSRSSFLSLGVAVIYLLFKYSKKKAIFLFLVGMAVFIIILPRGSGGEGVKLERMNSVYAKVDNYQQSLDLFKISPLFGVGYNNICSLKSSLINKKVAGNSCAGVDNSFLYILITTGVVGLVLFLKVIRDFYVSASSDLYGTIWKASLLAIAVHSLFTNTLFYSWVMAWLVFVTVISRKKLMAKVKS